MFNRAMAALIVTSAACAAASMAVFAAGFAIYTLVLPTAGPAGAAGIVALIAVLALALFAIAIMLRSRKHEREAAVAQAELLDELPMGLGDIARERPLVTLGLTALGGLLAARHPTLVRDVIAIVARFGRHR
jgi:hypothetical protein